MATYGIDFYGRSKYGTSAGVEFSAAPFTVTEFQYARLILRWASPQGNWTLFRLVKNLSGFAAYPADGETIIDINRDVDGAPPTQYDDLNCVPGRFYYYTIFVGVGSDPTTATWWRAGNAMNIATARAGWTDRLWDWVPRYYKRGDGSLVITDELNDENETLKRFLDVFGYQLDVLSTNGEALRNVNNADNVSYPAIEALSRQFGVRPEPELGPRIARSRVKNATYINRSKGTTQGLQALVSSVTGWSADIEEGNNKLLNADQSSFVHPAYPLWNAYINYVIGEIVAYNGNYFTAAAPSYGVTPPLTRTNNASWTWLGANSATGLDNPVTRGQSTWGIDYNGVVATSDVDTVGLGTGVQSTTDPEIYSTNALVVTNRSGSTNTLRATSIAPILAPTWSSVTNYVTNNYVTKSSKVYRALRNNVNRDPATRPDDWRESPRVVSPSIDQQQAIADGIPIGLGDAGSIYTASAYSQANPSTNGPVANTSVSMQFYDAYGKGAGFSRKPASPTYFDDFVAGTFGSAISSVNTVVPNATAWSTQTAISRTGTGYVWRSTATPGTYLSTIDAARASGVVGVTVRRFPTTGNCGVVGRWTNDSNYIRVGKTKIETVTAGVVATLADLTALGIAFTDGDRMALVFNASTLTLWKNNAVVWTGTSSLNTSATRFGLWVSI